MYKIAFDTFGCRLNQAETASLTDRFRERGYEVTDDPLEADLYVVNTCTLTSQATSKCRRKLRSVIRRNPDACVAAIGCYAQTDAEALRKIPGLDYIVGTNDKLRAAAAIETQLAQQPNIIVPCIAIDGEVDGVSPFTEHHANKFTGPYEYRMLENTGHNMPQENPAEWIRAILDARNMKA